MRKLLLILAFFIFVVGCTPTPEQIHPYVEQTLAKWPTQTAYPTYTPNPINTPTPTNTSTPIPTPTPTQVTLTIEEVIGYFIEAGLPITEIIYYTEETDPNELLGRPNQYIAKVNWTDERISGWQDGVQAGGSIELFLNPTDMQARKDYLELVTQIMSPIVEYAYSNGSVLLRVSHSLTPTQAQEYETILMSIP